MAKVEKEATGKDGSHSTKGSCGDAVDEDAVDEEYALEEEAEAPFGAADATQMPWRPGFGADNTTT